MEIRPTVTSMPVHFSIAFKKTTCYWLALYCAHFFPLSYILFRWCLLFSKLLSRLGCQCESEWMTLLPVNCLRYILSLTKKQKTNGSICFIDYSCKDTIKYIVKVVSHLKCHHSFIYSQRLRDLKAIIHWGIFITFAQVECNTKCQERKPLTKPPVKLAVQSKEFILQYQTGLTNLSLLS